MVLNNLGATRAYGCLSTSFSGLEKDTRRGGAFSLHQNQMRLPRVHVILLLANK
jgi:hypothetical protein